VSFILPVDCINKSIAPTWALGTLLLGALLIRFEFLLPLPILWWGNVDLYFQMRNLRFQMIHIIGGLYYAGLKLLDFLVSGPTHPICCDD
jgi:hypothetical protein